MRHFSPLAFSFGSCASTLSAPRRPFGAEPAVPAPPAGPARRGSASGAPLASLSGGALASRFFGWRGASGARYVCNVHRAEDESWIDVDGAVTLIVAIEADGARRLLDVEAAPSPARRRALRAQALAAGSREIHLHLLAQTPAARAAAAVDLLSAGAF